MLLGLLENDRSIVSVDAEQCLHDAVSLLRDNCVHRLLVVDSVTGNPLYILTYKRILQFLHQSVSINHLLCCAMIGWISEIIIIIIIIYYYFFPGKNYTIIIIIIIITFIW